MTALDTIRYFDVPRGCDAFRVDVDVDPEGVDAYCFAMRGGDVVHNATMVLTSETSTWNGKYYIELCPEATVELAVEIWFRHGVAYERALDRTDTLHDGDKLWFALRTGTSRYGIDR